MKFKLYTKKKPKYYIDIVYVIKSRMNRYITFDLAKYYKINENLFNGFQKPNSLLQVITENETLFIRTTSFSYTKNCVIPDYYMYPENYILCQSSEHGTYLAHNNFPNPPTLLKCPLNIFSPKCYIVKDVIVLF